MQAKLSLKKSSEIQHFIRTGCHSGIQKVEQGTAVNASLGEQCVFTLLTTDFGKSLVKNQSVSKSANQILKLHFRTLESFGFHKQML